MDDKGRESSVLQTLATGFVSLEYLSPDGKTLITSNQYNDARCWDVETGKQRATLKVVILGGNVYFSPDSSLVAVPGGT